MRIGILGSGPAGLLVAHAASQRGHGVHIMSYGKKSHLNGAQYLHKPIPGIPDAGPLSILSVFDGDVEGYRQKVYGNLYTGEVSPERFAGRSMAWDIRTAYEWLWSEYAHLIEPALITGRALMDSKTVGNYDLFFSTIPRTVMCVNKMHQFLSTEIYAIGDAPGLEIYSPIPCADEIVKTAGSRDVSWYRISRIFGHTTAEWARRPPYEGAVPVTKPIGTNCSCWATVQFAGRYGKWEKGVLTHHVYEDAYQTIKEHE